MRLLLDTHAFLWWVEGTPAVGRRARAAVSSPDNEILFSMASCWEIAIKLSLGKLRLAQSLDRFIPEQLALNGFSLLDVQLEHVVRVTGECAGDVAGRRSWLRCQTARQRPANRRGILSLHRFK